MNWKYIIGLWFLGIAMGISSIFGLTRDFEPFLWIIIALIVPVVIAKNTSQRLFFHGLLTGLGIGIVHSVIQSLFFDLYLSMHPDIIQQFQQQSFLSPRAFMIVVGPFIGIVYGAILGGLSVAAGKFFTPR